MNSLMSPAPSRSRLEDRLNRAMRGEVMFDRFSRGRYATDASFYQIMPAGVVVPKTAEDVSIAIQLAAEDGMPVLARGGGRRNAARRSGPGWWSTRRSISTR